MPSRVAFRARRRGSLSLNAVAVLRERYLLRDDRRRVIESTIPMIAMSSSPPRRTTARCSGSWLRVRSRRPGSSRHERIAQRGSHVPRPARIGVTPRPRCGKTPSGSSETADASPAAARPSWFEPVLTAQAPDGFAQGDRRRSGQGPQVARPLGALTAPPPARPSRRANRYEGPGSLADVGAPE